MNHVQARCERPRRLAGREDGSVFVESLVAAAVVALVLAATCRTVADSAARHRLIEARRTALMVARSQLAAVGFAIPVSAGVVSGSDAGYSWRADMAPCAFDQVANTAGQLYCVSVSVQSRDGGRPLATLNSRRLLPAA